MTADVDARRWMWLALDGCAERERESVRAILERLCDRGGAIALGEALAAVFDARAGQEYWRVLNDDERERADVLAALAAAVGDAQRRLWRGPRNVAVHRWLALGRRIIERAQGATSYARPPAERRPRLRSPLVHGLTNASAFRAKFCDLGATPAEAQMLVKALFASPGRP